MSDVDIKGSNFGSVATSGGRVLNVTGANSLGVAGDLTINQVPLPRQWLRPAETDPLKRWEQAMGRRDELDRLRARLAPAAGPPTAIWGMPGVGKSTLAALLAHEHGGDYPGGCLWASLGRGFRQPEQCQTILDHWASYAYGGDVQIAAQPEHWQKLKFDYQAVNALLGGHGPLLVVLDDVWDLAATDLLRQALPAEARLLLTTRDSRIADEAAGEAGAFALDLLTPAEALALLQARLPGLPEAALVQLAEGLGRHAQALSLAAGDIRRRGDQQRREQAVGEILKRLAEGQGFGELPQLDQRNRQSAVEVALRASYDDIGEAMGPDYQLRVRSLGSLGPAEASFSTAAAAALWDEEPAAAAEFLDVLRDRALIRQVGDDRWAQHLLVHAYNLALLRRANELEAARQRYLIFIVNDTDTAYARPPAEWGAAAADLPHVRFAGQWLYEQASALLGDLEPLAQPQAPAASAVLTEADAFTLKMALAFAVNMLSYVVERADEAERGQGWLWLGLAAARWSQSAPAEASFLFALGLWLQQRGWFKSAYQYHQASLALSRRLASFPHEPALLINLGQVALLLGEPDEALECGTQALEVSRQRQESINEGLAHNLLGMVRLALGQPEAALEALQAALAAVQAAHNPVQEAVIQQNIAYAYLESGQLQTALELFEQGLPLLPGGAEDAGNRATLLQNIGMTYYALRQPPQALKLLGEALPLARAAGDHNLEATILNNLAVVHEALGQPDEALGLLQEALPMLRAAGNRAMEAVALLNLGFRHLAAGRLEEAQTNAAAALAIFDDITSAGNAGLARFLLSNIYQRQGQTEQAAAIFQPVLDEPALLRATADRLATVAQGLGEQSARLQITLLAASLFRTANQAARAIELLEQALPLLDELDDTALFIDVYWRLLNLYTAAGLETKTARLNKRLFSNTQRAQALAAQIQADVQQLTDPAELAPARALLGSLLLATNQARAGLPWLEQALAAQPASDPAGALTLLNYLGLGYQALGQPQRARGYFERALPLAQAAGATAIEVIVLNNLGLTYRSEAEFDRAQTFFQQALELARQTGDRVNESVVLGNLGFVQLNRQQLAPAIETLNQALALTRQVENREQEIKLLTNLQQAYQLSQQLPAAQAHGELAVTLAHELGNKPLEATVLSNYGSFLAQLPGQQAAAVAAIQQAIELLETYHLPQDAAGQTPEQLRLMLAAFTGSTDPEAVSTSLMQAHLALLNAPDAAAARQVIETNSAVLLSAATDEALAMMSVAIEQRGLTDFAEIIRRYLRLLQACREFGVDEAFRAFATETPDALWHGWWGQKQLELLDVPAAEAEFSSAVALAPENASFVLWRARARAQLGRLDEALADYDRSLALQPDNGDAYFWRGRQYLDRRAAPAAQADFERATQLQPEDGMNWLWLGRAQHAQGEALAALSNLDRAVGLLPELAQARYWRARARLDAGQTAEALTDLQAAAPLESTPARAAAIGLWRGAAETLLGQPEVASQAWAQARALLAAAPTLPADLRQLALLEAMQARIGPAREHLAAAPSAVDPNARDQAQQLYQLARLFPQRADLGELAAWLNSQER